MALSWTLSALYVAATLFYAALNLLVVSAGKVWERASGRSD